MSVRAELETVSLSHPGMVRQHNEDSVYVDSAAGLAVLADGMGGYNAGEVASGIAVNVLSNGLVPELNSGRELSKVDIQSGLTHAALLLRQQIAAANKGIYEAAQARPECAGMGTTIVATVFFGNRVSIAHIGDSRCYRLRGDRFEQLTHDHSLLQEQIDSGQITQEQAKYSLNKNLVTRALGIEAIVPAEITEYRVEANDIYLLCSDGLTDMVDPEVVHEIVDKHRVDLAEAAAELIDLANKNGGRDNISVIIVQVPATFLESHSWAKRFLARKKAS
ncbi:MAG: Stp1/IreP family PP2C-type Ser/Thr phosphatase [Proteobacteria bacterium]|nr:Stp1/IreP family PP2C-type Ser/Thr phosphatase [Pseudomonadota bacterium]